MLSVFLFSSILNLVANIYNDTESLHRNMLEEIASSDIFFWANYIQMPGMVSPYLLGMYAA